MKKKGFLDGYETYDPEQEGYGGKDQWRSSFYERMSPEEAASILSSRNPYEVLGVNQKATRSEIKMAYRKLVMQWHPDRNPDKQNAHEMCQVINAAYSYLIGKK